MPQIKLETQAELDSYIAFLTDTHQPLPWLRPRACVKDPLKTLQAHYGLSSVRIFTAARALASTTAGCLTRFLGSYHIAYADQFKKNDSYAIINSHELAHVWLYEKRPDHESKYRGLEKERLTDITTLFLGGIVILHAYKVIDGGKALHKGGYLSLAEQAYVTAKLCQLKGEQIPWECIPRHLNYRIKLAQQLLGNDIGLPPKIEDPSERTPTHTKRTVLDRLLSRFKGTRHRAH